MTRIYVYFFSFLLFGIFQRYAQLQPLDTQNTFRNPPPISIPLHPSPWEIIIQYIILQGSHYLNFHAIIETFHYPIIAIMVTVSVSIPLPSGFSGCGGNAGRENGVPRTDCLETAHLPGFPPPPQNPLLKTTQLSEVSALGSWKNFSYKKYIRAKESGLGGKKKKVSCLPSKHSLKRLFGLCGIIKQETRWRATGIGDV